MELDRNGLEVLDRAESLRLLATARLGRIAITTEALPTVLPVAFRCDGRQILVRTGAGSKLEAATDNAVVAFEVDELQPGSRSGWSVVVTGVARELTEPDELAAAQRLPLDRWIEGVDGRIVAISLDLVSGRRLVPMPGARR